MKPKVGQSWSCCPQWEGKQTLMELLALTMNTLQIQPGKTLSRKYNCCIWALFGSSSAIQYTSISYYCCHVLFTFRISFHTKRSVFYDDFLGLYSVFMRCNSPHLLYCTICLSLTTWGILMKAKCSLYSWRVNCNMSWQCLGTAATFNFPSSREV